MSGFKFEGIHYTIQNTDINAEQGHLVIYVNNDQARIVNSDGQYRDLHIRNLYADNVSGLENYTLNSTTFNLVSDLQNQIDHQNIETHKTVQTNPSFVLKPDGVGGLTWGTISLSGAAVSHQFLNDLQGGQVNQYFHLNYAQYQDYIGKTTVQQISGTLNKRIDDVVATSISGNLSTYTPLTTTASISGYLNSKIDSINLLPGANVTIVESPANVWTISSIGGSISGDLLLYTLLSTTQGISGNLQNQIRSNSSDITRLASVTGSYLTSNSLTPYTLLSTTSSISGALQTQINAISGSYVPYSSLVTSIGVSGSNSFVPTEKAVRDAFNILGSITKEPTGFEDESAVSITGNADRTITLTQSGGVIYYYQSVKYTLTSPYTSAAHGTDTNSTYYLTFGAGGTFSWKTTPFDFKTEGQVSIAKYLNGAWRYFREVHGLMPWEAHLEAHDRLGTYLKSGGLLTVGTYAVTPSSPTDADNTPGVDSATIKDEDCHTSITAWTQGTYTQLWFVSSVANYSDIATLPFRTGSTYPLINTGGISDAETVTGRYFNVYAVYVPMALGTDSQKYRVIWFQPQAAHTSLALAQAESFYGLNLGNLGATFAEYAPYIQITYETSASYTGATGRCRIAAVAYLQGTRTSGGGSGANATSPGGTNGQVQ